MKSHIVSYSIEGQRLTYAVQGTLAESEERCLLLEDDDLTKGLVWQEEGYTVAQGWPNSVRDTIRERIRLCVREAFVAATGLTYSGGLGAYHQHVTDRQHLDIVARLKDLPFEAERHFPLERIDEGISRLLNLPVTSYSDKARCHACNIRIVRPKRGDNNPLHRDVWLDRLRHGINLYMPVAGSTELSSLSIIPGSHRWKESEIRRTEGGSKVEGAQYSVPSVVGSVHGLNMIRPQVKEDEILIFSPYCIHGGARNLSLDMTRVSLEMRFWRKAV